MYTATYSPEDNKLRIYSSDRIPEDTFKAAREAGFIWAPKQKILVAPMWTPSREDFCLSLVEEIYAEETTAEERAAERAERFLNYKDKRAAEASAAVDAVKAISNNIPLGQPILIGHHSQRKAEKAAQKIESGMKYAVNRWETSEYWGYRAKCVIQSANYKARKDVTARRIKKLESELRKVEKNKKEDQALFGIWDTLFSKERKLKNGETATPAAVAKHYANFHGFNTSAKSIHGHYYTAYDVLLPDGERWEGCPSFSIEQLREEALYRYSRYTPTYERWIKHYTNRINYEKAIISEGGGLPSEGVEVGDAVLTRFYDYCTVLKVNKVTVTIRHNFYGTRIMSENIPHDKIKGVVKREEIGDMREKGLLIETETGFRVKGEHEISIRVAEEKSDTKGDITAIKDVLKSGIKTVSAPQLFPTPDFLADIMIDHADIQNNERVLEPSAGTGVLVKKILEKTDKIELVEKNYHLCSALSSNFGKIVNSGDFLEKTVFELGGLFEKVVMNPPFENGIDIKHIEHALTMLKPGGVCVALCANGPRQQKFLASAEYSEVFEDAFKNQGTSVSVLLVVIRKPAEVEKVEKKINSFNVVQLSLFA